MTSCTPSRSPSRPASTESAPQRPTTPDTELSAAEEEKVLQITEACHRQDVGALIKLATSVSGLVTDKSRRVAWPILLACSATNMGASPWEDLAKHRDEHQVELDVNRAFVYYPTDETEKQIDRRKKELSDVILEVLRRHPSLCYFQGYHDIIQVFLLVLGPHDAPAAVARLSLLRIRDFMLSTLDPAIAQLELLLPILRAADSILYSHLPKSQPSFALANTITMFAHNIQKYKDITRLFDFFLAHHAVMPLYLFAAVVLSRREELLEIEEDEDIIYVLLSKLPQPFDLEFHITRTIELYERLPPASLNSWEWWRISSSSVLKASATNASLRRLTLDDGEKLLAQQETEVQRQQSLRQTLKKMRYFRMQIWYYRRYGAFGLAVIIGVYAVWLGRTASFAGARYMLPGSLGELARKFLGFSS